MWDLYFGIRVSRMSALHAAAIALIVCSSMMAGFAHAEPAPAATGTIAVSAARLLDVRPGRYPERPLILITGGHCDSTFFPPSMDQHSEAVADGPDALRRMVRLQHKYGAKVMKICATGGVFSNDAVGVQQMSLEEIRAVTDEAHMLNLRVAAHAHGPEGIRMARAP